MNSSRFKSKKQVIRRPDIGDMRHKIEIRTQAIAPINTDNPDFGENFTLFKTVWAKIDTVSGEEIFAGTSLIKIVTHVFTIRYIATLTKEFWIFYQGNSYKIVDVEPLDERKVFMKIRCIIRGDQTKPVNYA
jgi:SPP1 family predicted phage head-tail adaptor